MPLKYLPQNNSITSAIQMQIDLAYFYRYMYCINVCSLAFHMVKGDAKYVNGNCASDLGLAIAAVHKW